MRWRTVVLASVLVGGLSIVAVGTHYLAHRASLNRWRSSVLAKQRVGDSDAGWRPLIDEAAADPRRLDYLTASVSTMSDSEARAAADFAWHFCVDHPTPSALDLTMRLYRDSPAREECLEYLVFAWGCFPCQQTLDVLVEVASSPNATRRQQIAAVRSIGLACRAPQRDDARTATIRAAVEPMVQGRDAGLAVTAMLCLIRSGAVECSSAEEYRRVLASAEADLGPGDPRVEEIAAWVSACLKER